MKLGDKQRLFAKLLPALINQAHLFGFEVTIGDAYRDPRLHGQLGEKKSYGHRNSCHKIRLAIDLNLFLDGVYLTSTESHRKLGEWWESLHPLCRWGGQFNDGNHYSFEHDGAM
tara:strand:- start:747 stop:1088 length:342 start_codon:yes stop_codon:yes gene_type:complete